MTPTEGSVKKNEAIVYENLFGDLGFARLLVLSSMLVIE